MKSIGATGSMFARYLGRASGKAGSETGESSARPRSDAVAGPPVDEDQALHDGLGLFRIGTRVAHPGETQGAAQPVERWRKHINDESDRAEDFARVGDIDGLIGVVIGLSAYKRQRDRRVPRLHDLRQMAVTAWIAQGRPADALLMTTWLDRNYGPSAQTATTRATLALARGENEAAWRDARYALLMSGARGTGDIRSPATPLDVAVHSLAAMGRPETARRLLHARSLREPGAAAELFDLAPSAEALQELFVALSALFEDGRSDRVAALGLYSSACEQVGMIEEAIVAARRQLLLTLQTAVFGSGPAAAPGQHVTVVEQAALSDVVEALGTLAVTPFLIGRSLISFVKAGFVLRTAAPIQLGLRATGTAAVGDALARDPRFISARQRTGLVSARHISGAEIELFVHRADAGELRWTDGQSVWHAADHGVERTACAGLDAPVDAIDELMESYGERWLGAGPVDDCIDHAKVVHRNSLREPLHLLRRIQLCYLVGDVHELIVLTERLAACYEDFAVVDALGILGVALTGDADRVLDQLRGVSRPGEVQLNGA